MIPTLAIRDALIEKLKSYAPLETVIAHSDTDLGAALEHLRAAPNSLAVVVPGEDLFEHEFIPGTNIPQRTEIKNLFEVLISDRELSMRQDGAPGSLTFKDSVVALLLWDTLGVTGLICMPIHCEPMIVTFDEKNTKGREAWKITLEMRHTITG